MKCIYVLLFIICPTHNLWAQDIKDTNDLSISTIVGRLTQEESWERNIKVYADSLNYYSNITLPHFINDACFDAKFGPGKSSHDFESARWAILEGVSNVSILQKIIKSKNKFLDEKCAVKMPPEEPNYKASFRQLAKKRLQQIKNKSQIPLTQ